MADRRSPDRGLDPASRGADLLHDPRYNKGTAFTEAEREALGLRGLLPPRVHTQADQVRRVMENFRRKPTELERYIDMVALQVRNETLFYRVLIDHLEEMMRVIYTPTVGEACQRYGHIFQRPRGLFVSAEDRGRVDRLLANWPEQDVRVIVVTDGERILGLGDLGADGMGIPVGKLALYTACAGIHPRHCLPVTLDVGTDNPELLDDDLYIGLQRPRLRGAPYEELIDEFIEAVAQRFPHALVQFEDFANANAFRLLQKYRDRICCFNDDIQGTGAVGLAGLLAAPRLTGARFLDQRCLFLGAGEAGLGIGEMVVATMIEQGLAPEEARRRCWFVDSRGLIVAGRDGLNEHKRRFAHEHACVADFAGAVRALRPTAIVGVCGQPGVFDRDVLRAMAEINDRPIVFALSNPTSMAECTAEQAYRWTDGRAVFASGSPFDPVRIEGRTYCPGQGNNAYVFPGIGLGVMAAAASRVSDEMFATAAATLAEQVGAADLAEGRVYPPLGRIREVSAAIAVAVARQAFDSGLARCQRPADLVRLVSQRMYEPDYRSYV